MVTRVASVIMGANFGDEGKGLITDFEVRRTGAEYVARFNGGAQAGHTVHSEGKRHVFGHVGAGTFAGASTYLSSKFITNPFLLNKELKALGELGFEPNVSAHENARVSTLYDMALNAMAEISRGNGRHGSCGVGINETVTRHEVHELTLYDVLNRSVGHIEYLLSNIHQQYVPARMKELGITSVPPQYQELIEGDDYTAQAWKLKELGQLLCYPPRRKVGVVFEGAQGLALDEFMGQFPHVTRSITGLPYAIIAAAEMRVEELQPVYVTRSYLTRHGAGPLSHEGHEFGGYNVQDDTNIDNPWQGRLRYAPLNLNLMAFFINGDRARSGYIAQAHGIKIHEPTIAVTCVDQLHGDVTIVDMDGQLRTIRTSYLHHHIEKSLGLKVSHVSFGPESSDVQFLGAA